MTLNWYVFPEPSGSFATAAANCSKASGGAYNIKINFLSTSSDQQRVSLVRRLAANDPSIDILAMDVDWTAEFATAKWIRPVPAQFAAQIKSADLSGPVQTASWKGRLWAVPINSNTELLWYRKDLVPTPPKTWTQMIAEANQLAAQGKPHYIEEQGAQYEGLTVWFNSMVDSAGGQILDPGQQGCHRTGHRQGGVDHASARHVQGRRSVAQRLPGGTGTGGVRERHRRVHDQLPVRLVGDPGGQPQGLQRDGVRAVPRGHARCRLRKSRSAATTSASRPTHKHPQLAFDARCSA